MEVESGQVIFNNSEPFQAARLLPKIILKNKGQASNHFGCSFFAYRWNLLAYSGAFLLTVDSFSSFAYT